VGNAPSSNNIRSTSTIVFINIESYAAPFAWVAFLEKILFLFHSGTGCNWTPHPRPLDGGAGVLRQIFLARHGLQIRDCLADLFLVLAESLLEASQQFVFLAFGECQIVVSELSVFLFQLALELVPIAFDFEFSHTNISYLHGDPAAQAGVISPPFPLVHRVPSKIISHGT
jgi:hypothetical protein